MKHAEEGSMYKIINETQGTELGEVENPRYIRKHENGCFVQCDKDEAEGIAYDSVPYNYGDNKSIMKQPEWDEETETLIEPTEAADVLSVQEIA